MYSLTEIDGKGFGCISKREIKKGTLILREKPSLVFEDHKKTDFDFENFEDLDHFKTVIGSYLKMETDDQKEYLNLSNKFSEKKEKVSDEESEFIKFYTTEFENQITNRVKQINLPDIDLETAIIVYQICHTNSFHNGVCLKM